MRAETWAILTEAFVVPEELGVEHVEVGAGAEGVPAAADEDDPDVVVLLGAVERLARAP